MEIKAGDKPWGLNNGQTEKLKAAIGKQLKLTVRSVNRYLLILKTPAAVQAAFDRGELTLDRAGKVALLERKAQAEVARRIEAGEKASRVVAKALEGPGHDAAAARSFSRLLGALTREIPRIEGKAGAINTGWLRKAAPVLKQASGLLAELADYGRKN